MNILPFLDCTVHRYNNQFRFNVYRKPTNSGIHLHYFSHHPYHVKRSVLFGLILRAYRICDPEYLEGELDTIYTEFKKLGYPDHFCDKIHYDVRRKHFEQETRERPQEGSRMDNVALPFNKFTQSVASPILRQHNLRVNYKATNTLKKTLIRNRPTRSEENEVGIYRITCDDCPRVYLGQTGRPLNVRLREHSKYILNRNKTAAVYRHASELLHGVNIADASLIYKAADYNKRVTIESLLLEETPNFNIMEGSTCISKASKELIINHLPKIKRLCPNR